MRELMNKHIRCIIELHTKSQANSSILPVSFKVLHMPLHVFFFLDAAALATDLAAAWFLFPVGNVKFGLAD